MVMKGIFGQLPIVLGTYIAVTSCSEEQDFDQINDLDITPTLASSIFSFEADEPFINSTSTTTNVFYAGNYNFKAFNEQFVVERMLEGTVTYEFENTTSKPLSVVVEYLNGGDLLDVELFDIEPGPSPKLTKEVAYGPSGRPLGILTNTSNVKITGINFRKYHECFFRDRSKANHEIYW